MSEHVIDPERLVPRDLPAGTVNEALVELASIGEYDSQARGL